MGELAPSDAEIKN